GQRRGPAGQRPGPRAVDVPAGVRCPRDGVYVPVSRRASRKSSGGDSMHLATVRFGFSTLLLVLLLGCVPGPEPAKPKDAGGMETGGGVTYTKDVQPILMAKCAPCHTADGQGHHNIATSYADAFKKVSSTMYDDCYTGTLAMP